MEREHSTERISIHRPKKRGRRTARRILGLWARLALLTLAVGVLAVAAFGLAAKAVKPYREAQRQTRQLARAQSEASALDSENDALRQRIAYLKTPQGQMEEARKMGYVRPGEIPFVVESTMGAPAEPSPALPALASSTPTPASPDRSPGAKTRRLWNRATHLWRTEPH